MFSTGNRVSPFLFDLKGRNPETLIRMTVHVAAGILPQGIVAFLVGGVWASCEKPLGRWNYQAFRQLNRARSRSSPSSVRFLLLPYTHNIDLWSLLLLFIFSSSIPLPHLRLKSTNRGSRLLSAQSVSDFLSSPPLLKVC